VDHAVLGEVFGALETFRQFLADGLLDDARAGKADQRAGFGDLHVAEHRVRGGDAAGGRIGEHDDVRQLGFAQHLDGDRGARQLHQRQDAFLHARAAGGCEHDEGRAFFRRGFQALDDRFGGRHAERAAHEVEVLHRDHHRQAVELAEAELDRVIEPGLAARVLDAVGIAPLVAELERVDLHLGHADVEPGAAVEHRLEPRRRAHAHVVVGRRDDELIGFDVLVEHELAGLRTFDPEIFRRLPPQQAADFGPDDVGDPVHRCILIRLSSSVKTDDPVLAEISIHRIPCHGEQYVITGLPAFACNDSPHSAATALAERTPCASCTTRSVTALTVPSVALPFWSRLPRSASTSAEPTTTPSAPCAMARALSALRTPKPTATGNWLWRLMRATALATLAASGAAEPVMPVMET